jgi:surfactin synthase thioesterase subunit
MLPAVRADYTAIETYRARDDAKVSCPVTVLTGDNDPKTTLDAARAWVRHTTADCDVRVYPGGHFFLFDDVERITEDVSKVLAG